MIIYSPKYRPVDFQLSTIMLCFYVNKISCSFKTLSKPMANRLNMTITPRFSVLGILKGGGSYGMPIID